MTDERPETPEDLLAYLRGMLTASRFLCGQHARRLDWMGVEEKRRQYEWVSFDIAYNVVTSLEDLYLEVKRGDKVLQPRDISISIDLEDLMLYEKKLRKAHKV